MWHRCGVCGTVQMWLGGCENGDYDDIKQKQMFVVKSVKKETKRGDIKNRE